MADSARLKTLLDLLHKQGDEDHSLRQVLIELTTIAVKSINDGNSEVDPLDVARAIIRLADTDDGAHDIW